MWRVERHDTPGAFETLEREWTQLSQQLFPRLPFQTWHWNEAWWRHFAVDRPALKDALRIYAVRDEAGALRLLAPMVLTQRPARGPVRARYLHFFGADPNVTEVRGPLCLPADARDAYQTLMQHLDAQSQEWDWVEFGGVPWGSGGERALETRGQVRWIRETPDFFLRLTPPWETFKASRGRNLKESLRKCFNSLKREGLTHQLSVQTAPAEVASALDRFFALHRARSVLGSGPEHRDVFATERARAFLLEYARGGATRGETHVFELRVGGVLAASRVGFVLGDQLYLYFSGYRPEFARFSVMTTLVAEALEWAIGRGLAVANLSPGRDVSKTRWGPDEVLFRNAVLGSQRPVSHWKENAFLRARELTNQGGGMISRMLKMGVRSNH